MFELFRRIQRFFLACCFDDKAIFKDKMVAERCSNERKNIKIQENKYTGAFSIAINKVDCNENMDYLHSLYYGANKVEICTNDITQDPWYGVAYLVETRKNSKIDGGIPLCVSFANKDQVKRQGALWCPQKKGWFFDPDKDINLVKEWLPAIYHPEAKGPFVLPNMVPQNIWAVNLRSLLDKGVWDKLRKEVYQNSGYRCQICGGKGPNWPVECEEVWDYTELNISQGIASLASLVALCPSCHKIKHLGKANIDGCLEQVIWHMACINSWDRQYAKDIVDSAFDAWEVRSAMQWAFDFSKVEEKFNIKVKVDAGIATGINQEFICGLNS